MLQLMGCFAEFERDVMLERQREGVAKAKAEGKYRGRVPTAQHKAAEVIQLRGQGVKPEEIAVQLGIAVRRCSASLSISGPEQVMQSVGAKDRFKRSVLTRRTRCLLPIPPISLGTHGMSALQLNVLQNSAVETIGEP